MGQKTEKRKIIFKTHTNTGAEIIFFRYNNNWRKLHGLPVLRGITKFRWECTEE